MDYNTFSDRQGQSNDSGFPKHSPQRDGTDDEQTYAKNPVRTQTTSPERGCHGRPPISSPVQDSCSFNSEPNSQEMKYNVKPDLNTSQYMSGQNIRPQNPNYVDFTPQKPDNPANVGLADVLKQLSEYKGVNPNSTHVIHIDKLTIINNNNPDPTYYGNVPRPPEPCQAHQYDYPGRPRDEDDVYIGFPVRKTPVEHSGAMQASAEAEDNISPYRETQNFLPTVNNGRSQDTQSSSGTGQRNTEQVKSSGAEENPTQLTISHPPHSKESIPEVFGVELVINGSSQRWEGKLTPSTASGSLPRSPSSDTLDSQCTFDSHIQSRDRNRRTVPSTSEIGEIQQPMKRLPSTERRQKTSNDEGNTLLKFPSPVEDESHRDTGFRVARVVEDEPHRDTGFRVARVDNPMYMADQHYRLTNTLTSHTQNVSGYRDEMEPFRAGLNWNEGRHISQSAPDIRQVTAITPTHRPTAFTKKLKGSKHECVIEGFLNIHDEKAIEDAKRRLEAEGKDGNWLVTSAVRQPMHCFCLHVRLQNRTNSFLVNNLKNNKINIDTRKDKTFKCLCELIGYYTKKKNLPNQEVKLSKAFQLTPRGSGEYNTVTEVSHL